MLSEFHLVSKQDPFNVPLSTTRQNSKKSLGQKNYDGLRISLEMIHVLQHPPSPWTPQRLLRRSGSSSGRMVSHPQLQMKQHLPLRWTTALLAVVADFLFILPGAATTNHHHLLLRTTTYCHHHPIRIRNYNRRPRDHPSFNNKNNHYYGNNNILHGMPPKLSREKSTMC